MKETPVPAPPYFVDNLALPMGNEKEEEELGAIATDLYLFDRKYMSDPFETQLDKDVAVKKYHKMELF